MCGDGSVLRDRNGHLESGVWRLFSGEELHGNNVEGVLALKNP